MNALKKLKLKSMLRNCNYVLAGTVIKQQYYDSTRKVEVNQLIDTFMADPGFEHALKLIEFNDMMVFYFTESCRGGLYVRKTEQGADTFKTPPTREDPYRNAAYPAGKENAAYPAKKENAAYPTEQDPELSLDHSEGDLQKSQHLQLIKESEKWMDEMIARKPKPSTTEITDATVAYSRASLSATAILTEHEPAALAIEPHFVDSSIVDSPISKPHNEPQHFKPYIAEAQIPKPHVVETQTTTSRMVEPRIVEPKTKSFEAKMVEPKILQPKIVEPYIGEPRFVESNFMEPHTLEPHIIEPPPASSAVSPFPIKPIVLKQRNYSNVIATLEMDIHTMSKQLEEYQRKLSSYPVNERQLKAWIKSLEEAIHEFSDAIDLLEAPPR